MKQAEIDFCARWLELRGPDGLVWWHHHPSPTIREPDPMAGEHVPGCATMSPAARDHHSVYALAPRGADLVASYEAALAQGLRIVADDPSPPSRIDCDPDGREREGRYDDCTFCVGDACNQCGWARSSGEPACEHDVVERHEAARAIKPPVLVDCRTCDASGRVPLSKLKSDRSIVDLVEGADGRPGADGKPAAVVLPGWDVTCPSCKGARRVEAEGLAAA